MRRFEKFSEMENREYLKIVSRVVLRWLLWILWRIRGYYCWPSQWHHPSYKQVHRPIFSLLWMCYQVSRGGHVRLGFTHQYHLLFIWSYSPSSLVCRFSPYFLNSFFVQLCLIHLLILSLDQDHHSFCGRLLSSSIIAHVQCFFWISYF